jgi:topoisomerase-4 subunit A
MGGGKTRTESDMTEWKGARGGIGKRPPYGFPKNNKFS